MRGAVEHHYRAVARPTVTAEAWAEASPIAKQAAVGSSLEVIGEYARLSAAAGGFDRPEAQLRRALLKLDARGFAQLSKACEKLLERVEKIEADAAKRIGSDPHAEGVIETGLARAAVRGRAPVERVGRRCRDRAGRSRRRAPRDRKRKSAPATGSVVAGAGTEG